MFDANTMKEAPGATNSKGLTTDTNSPDSASHGCINQAPDDKAIARQIANLAMAGHAVHKLADSGFLVCKYGHTFHAFEFAELQAFARRSGVKQ
jgi:hypothetical protein